MILETSTPVEHSTARPGGASAASSTKIPAWLRRAIPDPQDLANQSVEEIGFATGAAIGALDALIRREDRWAGVWRQRLALAAATVTARQSGRIEDEKALRDAVMLTRPGDDVGPAGRMLLGWRHLAAQPASELLKAKSLAVTLEAFGHTASGEAIDGLAKALLQLRSGTGMTGTSTGAFQLVQNAGFGRAFGGWLADVLLSQRLGWKHTVPLLGTEPLAAAKAAITTGPDWEKRLLAAQGRAALHAIDQHAVLERHADRLLIVAPKLRARASDRVVERLLSQDALVASDAIAGISDRGLRRMFDRLVELGAVRELSGRPTFRIYGL